MPDLTCLPGTLDVRLHRDHETVRLWRSARPFPAAEATAMPRPSPATVNHISGLLLALTLLVGCGPNTVLVPAMQYGMNVGDLALSNLFDATDDDQPIDPEAIRAKGRAVCVEEQLTEADCARLMAQVEKNIDLVYRLQGLDAMAEASRWQRLQQALNRVNAATGIVKGTARQAGSVGVVSAVVGS